MKLNISLSHSREKRTCCNSTQNAACHYKSEGSEIMSLICSCPLLWIFNWSYLLKCPTLMFYKTSTQKTSSLWILSIMGIFASPLLKITWPMAYFSSQISILSSQLSGNHRRCLKEHKKWLVLIWREKKSWRTRQLLVAECYFFFSLCLHIFPTCVLCYPITSIFSLGKYLCFGIKEGPGVLLARTALALICCFWTEHIQWTHFKLGPLPSYMLLLV